MADTETDETRFSANMKRLREGRRWSQSEMARRMAQAGWNTYSQVAVSRTEKGERPIPLGEARAIARLLGTTVDEMVKSSEVGAVKDLEAAESRMQDMRDAVRDAANLYEDARDDLRSAVDAAKVAGVDESLLSWPLDYLTYSASDIAAWAESERQMRLDEERGEQSGEHQEAR